MSSYIQTTRAVVKEYKKHAHNIQCYHNMAVNSCIGVGRMCNCSAQENHIIRSHLRVAPQYTGLTYSQKLL